MTQHLSSRPAIGPAHRYLALCLPWLPAERALRRGGITPPDVPVALVEQRRGTQRIAALDPRAAAAGLEPGLGLGEARARVPELAALPFAPLRDAAAMRKLARLCGSYTPGVAIDPPQGAIHALILDITGCAHLHGGEQAMAAALVKRFGDLGITARAAPGDTPDAARALARFAAPDVAALPLAALADDGEALLALHRAGFRCIGDLAGLPRAPLAARFGGAMVRRLGYLLAEADPHIAPRRDPGPIVLCRRFAEPVARSDDVLAAIGLLLIRAAALLAERGAGGRAFAVTLQRSDGHVARLTVETGAATRDPALVVRLLRERIDSLADPLDPGFGYDAIELAVPRSEPLGETQAGLLDHATAARSGGIGPLLDRLAVRYGADSVLRFTGTDSHIPERAGMLRPVQDEAAGPALAPPATGAARPLLLFDPPQRVAAIASIPDGAPRRFAWRGRSHVVMRHEGPERIAPEWWRRPGGHDDNPGLSRDYYRVEDEAGHRFWLFRHGLCEEGAQTAGPPGGWYIHGVFA